MEYEIAKQQFISDWGTLGSSWGINKTMAQIHALLLITPNALSVEEIMQELQISRGNTSMNVRQLMDWGIVYKKSKSGDRKEYFTSEKNIEELARQVIKERNRRELQPVLKNLKEFTAIPDNNSAETKEFIKQTQAIYDFANTTHNMLEKITQQQQNWFTKVLMKFLS